MISIHNFAFLSSMVRTQNLNHFSRPPSYFLDFIKDFLIEVTKLNSVALVRERTIPTERPPLVGEIVPTFADRG
jgi:hypothetical protein